MQPTDRRCPKLRSGALSLQDEAERRIVRAPARSPAAFADTIRVLPPFDRLRIEPRDSTYVAGDTIWFRVMGLDKAGRVAAALPWPLCGRQVGPAAGGGAVPIVWSRAPSGRLAT